MNQNKSTGIFEANEFEEIRDLLLDVANNPSKYIEYEYKEQNNLLDDFKELIKSSVKYGVQFRYTNPESKKQMIYIDKKDNRIKLLGVNGNVTKSNTIFHYSRLKYIIAKGQNTLSIKAITKIIADRKTVKTIDIDHFDNNKQNNQLSNLKPVPHSININNHYDKLKKLIADGKIHQAKQTAKKLDVSYLLTYIL